MLDKPRREPLVIDDSPHSPLCLRSLDDRASAALRDGAPDMDGTTHMVTLLMIGRIDVMAPKIS